MNIGIVGAGASGLMAAYSASLNKNVNVYLLEKNEKIQYFKVSLDKRSYHAEKDLRCRTD